MPSNKSIQYTHRGFTADHDKQSSSWIQNPVSMVSKTKQTPESKERSQHWYAGIGRDCFICIELQHWQCLQLALSERKKDRLTVPDIIFVS